MTDVSNIPNNFKLRIDYGKIKSAEPIPDLMELQKTSYAKFLQENVEKAVREDVGLEGVLRSVFPIYANNGNFVLEYVDYYFDKPKYSLEECRHVGATYALPLKVKLRVITNDINPDTGAVAVEDVKEQEVYFGDVPLMLDSGTFIINGTERVVVSQIHRSPGVFFGSDKGKYTSGGKVLYSANIIPKRGSWLDIEFDSKDLLYAKIDKRKKFLASVLLKCLYSKETEERLLKGETLEPADIKRMSNIEILSEFYDKYSATQKEDKWVIKFIPSLLRGKKLSFDLINAENNEIIAASGNNVSATILRKIEKNGVEKIIVPTEEILGKFLAEDIEVNSKINFKAGDEITVDVLEKLVANGITTFDILLIDNVNVGPYILNTLKQDRNMTSEKALKEMYRMVKLTEPPSLESAEDLFTKLFFDLERYDLSEVGRVKLNERLDLNEDENLKVLTKRDIIEIFKTLIKVRDGKDVVDDIDHLGNRRIRSVGELLETEIRIALVKMQKSIIEKMNSLTEVMPNELINVRPLQAVFKEFFGVSQLSQFMDQTNPLSEITHKRRLSALGPKGLSRDRAGFEVRDVHYTHYGRICPIETPEGPNIGLINSLTIYARVNKYGFLETPYLPVKDGIVSKEVVYLTAIEEKGKVIAQSSTAIDKNSGKLLEEAINCRLDDDFIMAATSEVDYIDISPKQLVSVAASLVPFLENDDANRALMGANMQRQAVPLLIPEAPLVGTGMESIIAQSSGTAITSKSEGIVDYVDSDKIIVKKLDKNGKNLGNDYYNLQKFQKSNHGTCINQKPLVRVGQEVNPNTVLVDGHSCDRGELALGKNILVAFMPWNGYNFEDSILVSERIVKDDVFTSIHIEEFEIVARDTKLGPEEVTADIPGVGEESLRNLDEAGIVYIGAEVKTGDILVGKVTPKAESIVTPEEKLLRTIFGEKAMDVRDTSLRVPSGVSGTVIGVRVFSRRGLQKDARSLILEKKQIEQVSKDRDEKYSILSKEILIKTRDLLENSEVVSASKFDAGTVLTKEHLDKVSVSELLKTVVKDKEVMAKLEKIKKTYENAALALQKDFEEQVNKAKMGDDLPSNVLKMVKVYVAVKRKLQPGDKMAGRHGNKGVVSRIVATEDMPYLEDGTPVDICLNPLGVPSRMNIGQILEVHLGWASAKLGRKIFKLGEQCKKDKSKILELRELILTVYPDSEKDFIKNLSEEGLLALAKALKQGVPVATPVFDGLKEQDINNLLELADLDTSGQVTLIDGRTGEPFERKVTVGYMYMLKLHHLVDDKIHARSIGPYSLITQQPLGGKAQFGGQRFGEMEVWALEAYGAAYILKEMLTVKSDDQAGRTRVYEAIIRGEETFETGIPESFNVLTKELRSLGLDLDLVKNEEQSIEGKE